MNKSSVMIRTIVEVALFAALGFVFDELQGSVAKALFPNGGSIGFAIIAVIIISFRRGPVAGFATGLIMGVLDFSTGPYILNVWQVLLDYILPYALVGSAGFFKPLFDKQDKKSNKIMILIIATFVGGMLKLTSHFLSGGIFFAEYIEWEQFEGQPWLYSFLYNLAAVGPSVVLTMILLTLLYLRAPNVLNVPTTVVEEKQKNVPLFNFVVNPVMLASGLFLFIYFLIRYINSYYMEEWEGTYDISFDGDALMLFVTGLVVILSTTNSILRTILKKQNNRLTTIIYLTLSAANIIYPIARMIRLSIKGKDITVYWFWMAAAIVINVCFILLYLYLKKILQKEETIESA